MYQNSITFKKKTDAFQIIKEDSNLFIRYYSGSIYPTNLLSISSSGYISFNSTTLNLSGSLTVGGVINTIAAITASGLFISSSKSNTVRIVGSGSVNSLITVSGSIGQIFSINDNTTGSIILSKSVYIPDTPQATSLTNVLVLGAGGQIFYTASSAISPTNSTTGRGTQNYITFWSGSTSNLSSSLIYQDSVNRFIGIGTITPSASLEVVGGIKSINVTASAIIISASASDRLKVYGSGSTIFSVQGSQGELFKVTDSLTGSLFSVNDKSGVPVLEAFSDSTTAIGYYTSPGVYTSARRNVNSGSNQTIFTIQTASFDSAYFDYNIHSGSNARAGQIITMWSASTIQYTEMSTNSFGYTDNFELATRISGSTLQLIGSVASDSWSLKTILRLI